LMAEMLSMVTRICWGDSASRTTIQLTVSVARELRWSTASPKEDKTVEVIP